MFRLTIILFYFVAAPVFAQEQLDLSGLDEIVPSNTEPAAVSPADEPSGEQTAAAEPSGGEPVATASKQRKGLLAVIASGGIIGCIIMLLSLVSVALMFEHFLTIRSKILVPPGFADGIVQQLVQGQLAAAIAQCKENSSALAQILYTSMSQYEFGWDAVEKSAEEATAEQAAKLYRKVEYLNVIGNIAPMLGLLGTVVGMVFAFQQLAESEGYARAADLAEGIYLALVTTVQGLVVAIPSLAAYSFFNNRIASLMNETTFIAEQVLRPIKKSFARKNG